MHVFWNPTPFLTTLIIIRFQLAHIDTLDRQIENEADELEKRTVVLKKGIEQYTDLSEVQDSAKATRECLHDVIEKYKRALQLLDVLGNVSVQDEHKLDSSYELEEVKDLISKLCIHEQDLLNLRKQAHQSELNIGYGDLKADCLKMIDKINRSNITKQSQQNRALLSNPMLMRS